MPKSRFFNKAVDLIVKPVKFIRKQASLVERRITVMHAALRDALITAVCYGRN
jgi:hypothetical protein